MLRASAEQTRHQVNLLSIVQPHIDPELAYGRELIAFTDAAVLRDDDEMALARSRLVDVAGEAAMARASAVAGNFQMMNRLVDAAGVRVPQPLQLLAADLGLTVPEYLVGPVA